MTPQVVAIRPARGGPVKEVIVVVAATPVLVVVAMPVFPHLPNSRIINHLAPVGITATTSPARRAMLTETVAVAASARG